MIDVIELELRKLEEKGMLKSLRSIEQARRPNYMKVDGLEAIAFSSNDYLGLSRHPSVIDAGRRALELYGAGSTASRYINGNSELYTQLEKEIAELKGAEQAVTFSSGYLANLGSITSIAELNVNFHLDKLSHASIIDACRLSGRTFRRFIHNDVDHLERNIKKNINGKQNVIVTETLFSMDGDKAPLGEICKLAKDTGSMVITDCAHATGAIFDQKHSVDISIGTLSKALGCLGGFAACSSKLARYLTARSRPLIYTTGLPPATVASALAAVKLIGSDGDIQKRLADNVAFIRKRLRESNFDILGDPESPIVPIMVGDGIKALNLSDRLLELGFFIPAIRPPSVEPKKARLRLTVNALHQAAEIDALVNALVKAREKIL